MIEPHGESFCPRAVGLLALCLCHANAEEGQPSGRGEALLQLYRGSVFHFIKSPFFQHVLELGVHAVALMASWRGAGLVVPALVGGPVSADTALSAPPPPPRRWRRGSQASRKTWSGYNQNSSLIKTPDCGVNSIPSTIK